MMLVLAHKDDVFEIFTEVSKNSTELLIFSILYYFNYQTLTASM